MSDKTLDLTGIAAEDFTEEGYGLISNLCRCILASLASIGTAGLLAFGGTVTAEAQPVGWVDAVPDDWFNPLRWTGGTVPAVLDDVLIGVAGGALDSRRQRRPH